jgi:hypothetical protein
MTELQTSIDIERDFDLRNTLWRRGDTDEVKVTEKFVVPDELALSLVDFDLDRRLTVSCR